MINYAKVQSTTQTASTRIVTEIYTHYTSAIFTTTAKLKTEPIKTTQDVTATAKHETETQTQIDKTSEDTSLTPASITQMHGTDLHSTSVVNVSTKMYTSKPWSGQQIDSKLAIIVAVVVVVVAVLMVCFMCYVKKKNEQSRRVGELCIQVPIYYLYSPYFLSTV